MNKKSNNVNFNLCQQNLKSICISHIKKTIEKSDRLLSYLLFCYCQNILQNFEIFDKKRHILLRRNFVKDVIFMENKSIEMDKLTLLEKLELLYELEIQKPIEKIDTDFLDEIVLLGLELKGLTSSNSAFSHYERLTLSVIPNLKP